MHRQLSGGWPWQREDSRPKIRDARRSSFRAHARASSGRILYCDLAPQRCPARLRDPRTYRHANQQPGSVSREETNRDLWPTIRVLRIGRRGGGCDAQPAKDNFTIAPPTRVVKRFTNPVRVDKDAVRVGPRLRRVPGLMRDMTLPERPARPSVWGVSRRSSTRRVTCLLRVCLAVMTTSTLQAAGSMTETPADRT